MDFFKRSNEKHQSLDEPPAKRISTPAGQRLSVILENGDNSSSKTRDNYRTTVRKSGLTSAALGDVPRESIEEHSANSSGYTYSVWSDGEKFGKIRNHKEIVRRGGWRRLALIILIILALIIALAVGLAIGLKKKPSTPANDPQSPSPLSTSSPTSPNSPNPSTSTSLPPNFPLGTYSLQTFLDTIDTNCTSNPATWTCNPYTIYNTSPTKSLATFNWIISGSSSSKSKYQISSTENPFSISFQNAALELLDEGKDTERYRFQLTHSKVVSPSSPLTKDNANVECAFDATSLQAVLYTKMAKGYPDASAEKTSYPAWPFAVRIEQSSAGGENVPKCRKTSSNEVLSESFQAQDQSALCSCLYKNWRTPT